jgi:hypothetical protein
VGLGSFYPILLRQVQLNRNYNLGLSGFDVILWLANELLGGLKNESKINPQASQAPLVTPPVWHLKKKIKVQL